MERPQVADGVTASSMDGSCEYIENKQSRTAYMGGPPDRGFDTVLTTPQRKNVFCSKYLKELRIWTDTLVRTK